MSTESGFVALFDSIVHFSTPRRNIYAEFCHLSHLPRAFGLLASRQSTVDMHGVTRAPFEHGLEFNPAQLLGIDHNVFSAVVVSGGGPHGDSCRSSAKRRMPDELGQVKVSLCANLPAASA